MRNKIPPQCIVGGLNCCPHHWAKGEWVSLILVETWKKRDLNWGHFEKKKNYIITWKKNDKIKGVFVCFFRAGPGSRSVPVSLVAECVAFWAGGVHSDVSGLWKCFKMTLRGGQISADFWATYKLSHLKFLMHLTTIYLKPSTAAVISLFFWEIL